MSAPGPDAPTILRVYPGAAGQFSLYQDAGDGHWLRARPVQPHADRHALLDLAAAG